MNFGKSWNELESYEKEQFGKTTGSFLFKLDEETNRRLEHEWEVYRRIQLFHKEAYAEYLKSEAWQALRSQVLQRDHHKCRVCGAPASDVHHLTYDRKFAEPFYDLVSLCKTCHDIYHSAQSRLR